MSHFSAPGDESTYLGMLRLYSLSRISSRDTTLENLGLVSLSRTASAIRLMSLARSLLFLPSLMNPFEASIISTSVLERFCLSTKIIVGIPVPKKIPEGKPIIASIWLCSISCLRISPSAPPRKSTPCGNTIFIIPSGFKWYKSCRRNAKSALVLGASPKREYLGSVSLLSGDHFCEYGGLDTTASTYSVL